jgi:hypothetical protein
LHRREIADDAPLVIARDGTCRAMQAYAQWALDFATLTIQAIEVSDVGGHPVTPHRRTHDATRAGTARGRSECSVNPAVLGLVSTARELNPETTSQQGDGRDPEHARAYVPEE